MFTSADDEMCYSAWFESGVEFGERLAKIEVLEKIVEMHELSPKTYPEIIRDMIAELKEANR